MHLLCVLVPFAARVEDRCLWSQSLGESGVQGCGTKGQEAHLWQVRQRNSHLCTWNRGCKPCHLNIDICIYTHISPAGDFSVPITGRPWIWDWQGFGKKPPWLPILRRKGWWPESIRAITGQNIRVGRLKSTWHPMMTILCRSIDGYLTVPLLKK